MKFRIETQNRLLRRVARVHDDELTNMAREGGSRAFLEEVTSMPHRPAAKISPDRRSHNTGPRGRSFGAGRTLYRPILVGAVVLVLLVAIAVTGVLWSEPVAAGVKITTRNGYYVAKVTDPEASSEQMSAAFDQLGLDIELQLVPVSPTLVGTVVAIGDEGGAQGIETLRDDERCVTGGGSCPVGLRIPLNYSGHAEITLGRSAEPGEQYLSMADALASGEALHCSGLYGAPVERVLSVLNERDLTATFQALVEREGRQFSEEVDASEVRGWYVRDTLPRSKGHVVVQVSRDAPPPPPSWYEETIQKGCR